VGKRLPAQLQDAACSASCLEFPSRWCNMHSGLLRATGNMQQPHVCRQCSCHCSPGGKPLAQQTCVPYSPTLRRARRPTRAGARAGIVVGVCYLVMSCPCTYNLLRTHRCSGSPPMRSCPRNCICTVISLDCCCALCRLYVDCSLCDGLALLFK
jgi:hypothetical protein